MLKVLHARISHTCFELELMGNFIELHALSIHLDLAPLHTAQALDTAISEQTTAVARAIHTLAIG